MLPIQYIHNKDISSFESFQLYIKGLNVDGIIAIETFEKEFILKLINLGYPLYARDYTSDTYNINNVTEYFLGNDNILYIIYAYGNQNHTSEMDIVEM